MARHVLLVSTLLLSLRLVNDFSCSELWLKHITTNSTFPSGSLATSDDCFDIARPISLFCGLLQCQLGNVNEFTEICIRKNCAATPAADYSKQLLSATSWITSCGTCIIIIQMRRSVKSVNLKQKYLHARIAYYSNSTATGKFCYCVVMSSSILDGKEIQRTHELTPGNLVH